MWLISGREIGIELSSDTIVLFSYFLGEQMVLAMGNRRGDKRHREIRVNGVANRGGHSALLASSLTSTGTASSLPVQSMLIGSW